MLTAVREGVANALLLSFCEKVSHSLQIGLFPIKNNKSDARIGAPNLAKGYEIEELMVV